MQYNKISDTVVEVVEETPRQYTVQQIKHRLDGINRDIVHIQDSYDKQFNEFVARKEFFENLLIEADKLGVAEPIPVVVEEPKVEGVGDET